MKTNCDRGLFSQQAWQSTVPATWETEVRWSTGPGVGATWVAKEGPVSKTKKLSWEAMVCVRREREATVQGIRGLTHLRNAGNEVMEKTLSEIKPHRFVKVLSASQDAITHISRLRPAAFGHSALGCRSVTPWCFSSQAAVAGKFGRSWAASKNCPNR